MQQTVYIWFSMVAVMMTMFLVTGGTRLGFGMWYLFVPKDERKYLIQAIHPQIDGSALWVVLTASALYLLFPRIYRALFAGFYPVIAVIFIILVLRMIALSLRRKFDMWHFGSLWDVLISLGNLLPLFMLGLIAGYILKGVPLYGEGRFNVNVLGYISHYTIVSGLIIACASAALSYTAIAWNSDGRIRGHARKWAFYSGLLIIVLVFDLSLWSLLVSPYVSESIKATPVFFMIPATTFAGAVLFPVLIWKRSYKDAYLVAAFVMVGLSVVFFLSIFPHLRVIFQRTNTAPTGLIRGANSEFFQEILSQRRKLLPVYLFLMAATVFLQVRMLRLYRRFAHCPLPHDESDEELF